MHSRGFALIMVHYSVICKGPSQKFAEARWNEQNSLGRVGFSKKSHFRLQMVFCIHIGLRVEAWRANFYSFRGEGVQVKLILFVSLGFCELLRWTLSYKVPPFGKLLYLWQDLHCTLEARKSSNSLLPVSQSKLFLKTVFKNRFSV